MDREINDYNMIFSSCAQNEPKPDVEDIEHFFIVTHLGYQVITYNPNLNVYNM